MAHSNPYRRMPNLMIAWLGMVAVKLINYFPSNTVISGTLVPQEIVELWTAPYYRNLPFNLVEYVQL